MGIAILFSLVRQLTLPIHALLHHTVDVLIWASLRARDPNGSGKVAVRQSAFAQLARVKPVSAASVLRRMRLNGFIRAYRWKKVRGHLTYTIYLASLHLQNSSCGGLVVTEGELKRMQKLPVKELRIRAVQAATDLFQRNAETVWWKRQKAVLALQMENRKCKRYRKAVMPEVISAAALFSLAKKTPARLCPWVKFNFDKQKKGASLMCHGRVSQHTAETRKKEVKNAIRTGDLIYFEQPIVHQNRVIIGRRQRIAAIGQERIAEKLGVTREYVNRCLQNKPRFHVFQDWGNWSAHQVQDSAHDPRFYGPQFFVHVNPSTGGGRLYRRLPCLYQSTEHVRFFKRRKRKKLALEKNESSSVSPADSATVPSFA